MKKHALHFGVAVHFYDVLHDHHLPCPLVAPVQAETERPDKQQNCDDVPVFGQIREAEVRDR